MSKIVKIDVLVVGSGPAGVSTALHLVAANPAWANRVVVVDKAVHPREKLCGGGITRLGEDILTKLGLTFDPPHIPVREIRFVYGQSVYAMHDDPVFRVVRRDEFDHWLVQRAQKRGVTIRQGEAVQAITPQTDFIEVVTEKAVFHANVLVGADGSRSFVRKAFNWHNSRQMARLLEVLTPENADRQIEFKNGIAIFDFSQTQNGLQGYTWDFPSLIKTQPFMNRGIFDSRTRTERPRARLKPLLEKTLVEQNRNLDNYPLQGHPIHRFDPQGRFAAPRVLLVGDAAGVDPMLGEGISFALAYGDVAAQAIIDAFARDDFRFTGYKALIFAHPVLSQLRLRTLAAKIAYRVSSKWLFSLCWKFVPGVIRMVAWINSYSIPVTTPRLIKMKRE